MDVKLFSVTRLDTLCEPHTTDSNQNEKKMEPFCRIL